MKNVSGKKRGTSTFRESRSGGSASYSLESSPSDSSMSEYSGSSSESVIAPGAGDAATTAAQSRTMVD